MADAQEKILYLIIKWAHLMAVQIQVGLRASEESHNEERNYNKYHLK